MGLQIQRRVHLPLHQGKTINSENNTRRFSSAASSSKTTSKKTINSENKREDSEMSSNLPEALEVFRAAWLIFTKTEISIKEIVAQEIGLGLIGLENRCLTRLLEAL